jgi:Chaperone of endosialidase
LLRKIGRGFLANIFEKFARQIVGKNDERKSKMKTVTNFVCRPFALFAFMCAAISPATRALNPPPDGGYPGGNTAEGTNALFSLTTGGYNTALGFFSLRSNTTGSFNTAVGAATLLANTGAQNTATGAGALLSNTSGAFNTANGAFALFSNTGGSSNTALGNMALFNNTSGDRNTALGESALIANTMGASNTAMGVSALRNNVSGNYNTAVGHDALVVNEVSGNTAVGFRAAYSNTNGASNTAVGYAALFGNSAGDENTAVGASALSASTTGGLNTAIGSGALANNASGANTALGWHAGINNINGFENIYIGNEGGGPNETNVMRLGRSGDAPTLFTYIEGIFGINVSGTAVYIDSDGELGTVTSSIRYKHSIKDMNDASDVLLALRPVSFRYKPEIDPAQTAQFGLVAEEVEKVQPDLVVRDRNGNPYSVRYEAINAMLLNEFLKEHRKVEQQQATITELKATVAQQRKDLATAAAQQENEIQVLRASLKEQASQIQKVSAQIETSKPGRQVASRD